MLRAMKTSLKALLVVALGASALGCGGDPAASEDNLTSATARERQLSFDGYVYVHPDASDDEILASVHAQTRSAFGALSTRNVMVGTRELANVDPSTFRKELVTVFDNGSEAYASLRVRYTYIDRAVVPKSMAHVGSMSLGLLHGDYASQATRILEECSLNTADEQEMRDDIWYVFNPSLAKCRDAMTKERDEIAEQREGLDPATEITMAELERLYVPMTASLEAASRPKSKIYPEYDRLWSGGVQSGKFVITLLNGLIDHAAPGKKHHPHDDSGYFEMMSEMDVILQAHPDLRIAKTDPPSDMSRFTVDGNEIVGVTFQNFVDWELYDWGYPTWMNSAQKLKLRRLVAQRLMQRWVTLEKPVDVAIDGAAPQRVTVQINQYFGVDEEHDPYKRGIRESDVFLYNGHSFIGAGPLDPSNFTMADFPDSYQLLFIDSCLSFNYYNSDYFSYKANGSQDLDIITNGLESWSDGAGAGQGRFVAALLSDDFPSYAALLEEASTDGSSYAWGDDALRVVDGELDNTYSPSATPIDLMPAK